MHVRIGDYVRFISEKTEGKVVSIINENTVNVYCEEYGFDIPASIHDLVVIKSDSVTPENTPLSKAESTREATDNLYIGFIPDKLNNLTESRYELCLINDTTRTVLFSLYFGDGNKYTGVTAGSCHKNSTTSIGFYTLKDIDHTIKSIHIQAAFFSKEMPGIKAALETEIKINPVNLCKSGGYKQSPWLITPALTYPLRVEKQPEPKVHPDEDQPLKKLVAKYQSTENESTVEKPLGGNIIEVDLHADSLLDTTAGMDNKDILEYQIDTFHKTLEKYKLRKGQKIVFIHGKGEGVLRQRILWELQTTYKRFRHQDASFKQYGYGATLVTIK